MTRSRTALLLAALLSTAALLPLAMAAATAGMDCDADNAPSIRNCTIAAGSETDSGHDVGAEGRCGHWEDREGDHRTCGVSSTSSVVEAEAGCARDAAADSARCATSGDESCDACQRSGNWTLEVRVDRIEMGITAPGHDDDCDGADACAEPTASCEAVEELEFAVERVERARASCGAGDTGGCGTETAISVNEEGIKRSASCSVAGGDLDGYGDVKVYCAEGLDSETEVIEWRASCGGSPGTGGSSDLRVDNRTIGAGVVVDIVESCGGGLGISVNEEGIKRSASCSVGGGDLDGDGHPEVECAAGTSDGEKGASSSAACQGGSAPVRNTTVNLVARGDSASVGAGSGVDEVGDGQASTSIGGGGAGGSVVLMREGAVQSCFVGVGAAGPVYACRT